MLVSEEPVSGKCFLQVQGYLNDEEMWAAWLLYRRYSPQIYMSILFSNIFWKVIIYVSYIFFTLSSLERTKPKGMTSDILYINFTELGIHFFVDRSFFIIIHCSSSSSSSLNDNDNLNNPWQTNFISFNYLSIQLSLLSAWRMSKWLVIKLLNKYIMINEEF
jgi:hypothetical protein